MRRLLAIGVWLLAFCPSCLAGKRREVGARVGYPKYGGWEAGKAHHPRLIAVAALLMLVLAGCAASPEASRVRGEPGADVGNHGNPVELLAPPDRFERVYSETPYDGPAGTAPDTAES